MCTGWTARDVVGHLTDWIPGFFGPVGVDFPVVPSVQDDPVGARPPHVAEDGLERREVPVDVVEGRDPHGRLPRREDRPV